MSNQVHIGILFSGEVRGCSSGQHRGDRMGMCPPIWLDKESGWEGSTGQYRDGIQVWRGEVGSADLHIVPTGESRLLQTFVDS